MSIVRRSPGTSFSKLLSFASLFIKLKSSSRAGAGSIPIGEAAASTLVAVKAAARNLESSTISPRGHSTELFFQLHFGGVAKSSRSLVKRVVNSTFFKFVSYGSRKEVSARLASSSRGSYGYHEKFGFSPPGALARGSPRQETQRRGTS